MAKKVQKPQETAPEPQEEKRPEIKRVIWSKDADAGGNLVHGEPPAVVRIGMQTVELPDAATQLRGFPSEHADLLVSNIPGYKILLSRESDRG